MSKIFEKSRKYQDIFILPLQGHCIGWTGFSMPYFLHLSLCLPLHSKLLNHWLGNIVFLQIRHVEFISRRPLSCITGIQEERLEQSDRSIFKIWFVGLLFFYLEWMQRILRQEKWGRNGTCFVSWWTSRWEEISRYAYLEFWSLLETLETIWYEDRTKLHTS